MDSESNALDVYTIFKEAFNAVFEEARDNLTEREFTNFCCYIRDCGNYGEIPEGGSK